MTEVIECSVQKAVLWFQTCYPEPKIKNLTTQLGVHFEEVAEMLDTLDSDTPALRALINDTAELLEILSNHLKQTNSGITIKCRKELLDALCDQIVTASGVGHMIGLDVAGGMQEVNRSNFSKFDENGNPIFDENKKVRKSALYTPPDLNPFI